MSKVVRYLLTLTVDVEIDDENEFSENMNFGKVLEDGNISIYANLGNNSIVGCEEKESRFLCATDSDYLQTVLEACWYVRYADGVVREHSRTMLVDLKERTETKLHEFKTTFKEFLRQDAICDHAVVGRIEVFELAVYLGSPINGEEYIDGEEHLSFTWNGTWVEEVIE